MNKEIAYHIACKQGDIGKYVFLTGDPKRCEKIAEHFENPKKIAENREFVTYSGFLHGEKVNVISTGIGGPSAAIAIEEAVHLGADTFIRIGTCGGISTDVLAGDLVIAQSAVRQEGTTLHYAPPEFPATADFELTLALKESTKELGFGFHLGIVQSKDSFYGQHSPERMPVSYELQNKWEAWIRLGVLCSEMECAALFCVASALKVRMGAVLLTVWNQERQKAGLDNEEFLDTNNAVLTAITAMTKFIDKK
jgi:uridine phosphorylase